MRKEQVHGGDVYRHRDVLDFSSNMNPLGTPGSVIEAAAESLRFICNYPDVRCEELVRALSDHEGVPQDWVICGNGAAELIFLLAAALKPSKALVLAPSFAEYQQALDTQDCRMDYYDLTEEMGFLPAEDLLERIDSSLNLMILCNPNNPTGLLMDPELLERVVERCSKTGTFLLVDECFQDFLDEEKYFSMKHRLGQCRNLFLLKAFTKRYAMAGLRLGYGLCGNKELLQKMQACVQPWNVSLPAQAGGLAALKEEEYVQRARKLVQKEREFLKRELRNLGFKVYDSQANYIFFRGPKGLAEQALEKRVLIRDCSNYRGLSEGYYRVAVRTHAENIRLLEALAGERENPMVSAGKEKKHG